MNKLLVKAPKGVIYHAPNRTVPVRPAHATRRFLSSPTGIASITPHPEMVETLDSQLPGMLRECITIFLQEHCIFNEKDYLWRHLQKGNLSHAIGVAVQKLLTHKEDIHKLFAASGGQRLVTAYLVAAQWWDEAAAVICQELGQEKYLERLTAKSRPRGGMPAFDEAMLSLAELVERGDWEY